MFLLLINVFQFLNSIIEIFIVELITLIIIIGQINMKNRIVNLESKPMSYLGKLSFGIYVYHPLIILILCPSNSKLFCKTTDKCCSLGNP